MEWLIPLAAKSFVIAGGALLLLRLLRNRSAADRSWIAHLALAGLLLLPLASLALPRLDVAAWILRIAAPHCPRSSPRSLRPSCYGPSASPVPAPSPGSCSDP